MGRTYTRAPKSLVDLVGDTMQKYHTGLADAEVSIDILLAHGPRDKNDDLSGPAIKVGGYPAKAKVRITSLAERAFGRGDAEIILDGDQVDEWSEEELAAIVDHELSHLAFAEDRDDLDRPKLRTVKHDRQFGWFDAVAKRHGRYAIEVQQAEELFRDHDVRPVARSTTAERERNDRIA